MKFFIVPRLRNTLKMEAAEITRLWHIVTCRAILNKYQRFTRITPVYIFVLGFVTTWWRHSSDGPTWAPLVEAECARCRAKWWSQLLYVNNFVKPNEKCLIQTWWATTFLTMYFLLYNKQIGPLKILSLPQVFPDKQS